MKGVHLCRRLVLEAPERIADDAGGFEESWVALGIVWADVRLRSGRETSDVTGRASEADYKIILRATPSGAPSRPVPGQRFVEGIRRFLIEAVSEADSHGRYLVCFAREELVL
jgi:head-tail adaptor